jgi:hypothetical protein
VAARRKTSERPNLRTSWSASSLRKSSSSNVTCIALMYVDHSVSRSGQPSASRVLRRGLRRSARTVVCASVQELAPPTGTTSCSTDLDEAWAVERGLQLCAQKALDIALAPSAG